MTLVNVTRTLAFAIFGGYVFGLPAQAAGLDCASAKSKVERLICDEEKNPNLVLMDNTLQILYNELLKQSKRSRNLVAEQTKWLKEIRNVCDDAECLRKAYISRISEFQGSATLCNSQEIVVFSCALPKRKLASLCASKDAGENTGYMQLRLGSDQKTLEMQLPKERTPAKTHFKYAGDDASEIHAVSFWSGENRFSVFELSPIVVAREISRGAGLIVSHGHPPIRVSYSKCVSDPITIPDYKGLMFLSLNSIGKELGLHIAGDDISAADEAVLSEPKSGEPER